MNTTFRAGVPQLFVDVDRVKAKRLDVPLSVIFNTLQANLGSAYVNDFNLFGRTWKVYVQADEPYRIAASDITRLEVRSNSGKMVPLSTLVDVQDTVGPTVQARYNLYSSATITGDAGPGYSSGQSIAAMEEIARNSMPPSMGFEWSGVTYQQLAAGGAAGFIFALALVFVYLFLAAQYESWTLPLRRDLLGADRDARRLGADPCPRPRQQRLHPDRLRAADRSVGQERDPDRRVRQPAAAEGKTPFDAAREAARLRFRPILMTAFSFILGVMPLLIATGAGAASRVALGTAVFGGMLFATVFGIFVIPWLYFVVQSLMREDRRQEDACRTATGRSRRRELRSE